MCVRERERGGKYECVSVSVTVCHCVCEWDGGAVSAGWWDTLLEKVLPQYRAV